MISRTPSRERCQKRPGRRLGAHSDGSTARLLKTAFASRSLLLDVATALAAKALIPRRAVEKIREGCGNIDAVTDCVALNALFIRHAAAIKGRHPLARSDIVEAGDVGNARLKILQPKRARARATPADVARAADHRDRLWTLLVQRFESPHGHERAAVHLWGRDAAQHVAPLLSFTPNAAREGRREAHRRTSPYACSHTLGTA